MLKNTGTARHARQMTIVLVVIMSLGTGIAKADQEMAANDGRPNYPGRYEDPAPWPSPDPQDAARGRSLVRLNVTFKPEGRLTPSLAETQRERIRNTGDALLRELSGTRHFVYRRYQTVPYLAIDLRSAEATSRAARSRHVLGFFNDDRDLASLAQSRVVVGADLAETRFGNGSGTTVAVLDSGVDRRSLSGVVVDEACFSITSSCPNGRLTQLGAGSAAPCGYDAGLCSHGTHVAGIAANRTNGIARGATIMAVTIFSREPNEACTARRRTAPCGSSARSDQLAGMEHVYLRAAAGTFNVAALNMSLGAGHYSDACDAWAPYYKDMADNLWSVNVATVAASGNDGYSTGISLPACVSSIVSVGRTRDDDTVATGSTGSNSAPILDLLAPGTGIRSTVPAALDTDGTNDGFQQKDGTSMSAPHVAAAFAILHGLRPTVSVGAKLHAIKSTGRTVTDLRNGVRTPRLDVGRAADVLVNGQVLGPVGHWTPHEMVASGCPAGQVMVGIRGSAGSYVDSIQAVCRAVAFGALGAGSVGATVGDTSAPVNYTRTCPSGTVVAGMRGWYGAWIDWVQLKCRTLDENNLLTGDVVTTERVGGTGGNTQFNLDCSNSRPVSIFGGRGGFTPDWRTVVYQLQMTCA